MKKCCYALSNAATSVLVFLDIIFFVSWIFHSFSKVSVRTSQSPLTRKIVVGYLEHNIVYYSNTLKRMQFYIFECRFSCTILILCFCSLIFLLVFRSNHSNVSSLTVLKNRYLKVTYFCYSIAWKKCHFALPNAASCVPSCRYIIFFLVWNLFSPVFQDNRANVH